MKKITKFTIFLAAFAVFGQSCKKALNLSPEDQLSDASYWKTPNDFKLAANSFYSYERSFADILNDNPHSDYRGDMLTENTKNLFSNGQNSVPVTDGNYNTAYTRIRNINYLLAKAAAYSAPATIKQYVAEAKFFRAYEYFELLEMYGGVTIVTTPLSTGSPELNAARNTRDEVVDFILSDLNAAIPDLPLESAIASGDKGRISQGAAQSFLGRVALYEGTWQKFRGNTTRANTLLTASVAASNAVISSNQYSLFKPAALGDSALKYMFILENQKSNPAGIQKSANTEYILANRYDQTLRTPNLNITHSTFANVYWPTKKFANSFLCTDGLPIDKSPLFQGYATMASEFQNRDHRMKYTLMVAGKPYWYNYNPGCRVDWNSDANDIANAAYKSLNPGFNSGYQNQKWSSERQVPDYYEGYDYPVIRYAEVLLNYAEAVFELNGSISDADLDKSLNLVRQRVNTTMPKLSNGFVGANGLDMRTEIRRERTVELYFEGFRVDDLKRWKTAETELPMPLLGITWTGTQFQTSWPGASSLKKDANGNIILESGRTWSDKDYLLPIPTQQLQLNPKLSQNPGW
jgi:hypothetical protein